jgi:hypothetical protein
MAVAKERLVIEVEVDLKNQAAVQAFARATAADFKAIQTAAAAVNVTTRQMNQALAGSAAAGRALQAAARGAAAALKLVQTQGAQTGRSFRDIFQNAVLGFQIFQVGLKNVGSQGFNQLFKGVQDLTRNIFRSFRGISTEGTSIFGKLISFVGSSLEGVVTIAGNTASNVIKAFASIPKAIGGIFGGILQSLGGSFLFLTSPLLKVVGIFTSGFGSIAKTATDVLGGALSTVGQIAENISRLISGVLRGITTVAREVADRIVAAFEGIVGGISAVFGIIADIAAKALGAIGIAGGVAAGIVLKDFATFDTGIRRIFGAVGASTAKAREDLTGFANAIRTEFGRGAEEVTGGLFLAVTSGADSTAEALDNFRQAVRLTTAFGGDLNTTLLTVSRTLEVYRGEVSGAAEVADLLAAVVKEGQAEFGELAQSIGNVTATAAAAGIPLRELLAVLSTLTQRLPTDVAVTSLNRLIETLVSAQPEADAFRRKIGLAFTDLPPQLAKVVAGLNEERAALQAQADDLKKTGDLTDDVKDALKGLDEQIESVTRRGRQFGSLTDSVRQFFEAVRSGRATAGDIRTLFPEARERRGILQLASEQGFISLEQANKAFEDTTGLVERQLIELQDSLALTFNQLVQQALVNGNEIARAFGPVIVDALKEFRIVLAQAGTDLQKFFASSDFTSFRDNLRDSVVEFVRNIPAAVRSVVEFGGQVRSTFEDILAVVGPILDTILAKIRVVFDAFKQGPSLRNVFEGLSAGDFGPLTEKLSAAFAEIRLDPLFTALEVGLRNVVADIIDLFALGMERVASILGAAIAGIKEAVGQVAGILRPLVGIGIGTTNAGIQLVGTVRNVSRGFEGDTKGAAEGRAELANVSKVSAAVSSAVDSALAAAEKLKGSFSETRAAVEADVAATVVSVRDFTASIREGGDAQKEASAHHSATTAFVKEADRQAQALGESMKALAAETERVGLERLQSAVREFVGTQEEIEGFFRNVGRMVAEFIKTGSASIVGPKQGPGIGGGPAKKLTPEEEAANRRAIEAAERAIREAKANSDRIAKEIQEAKDAIVDANLEAAELVRDRLDALKDTASADIGQLATLGRRNTSFSLQNIRDASEQKKLAAGTLKGIDLLARAFADLSPTESAVLDPALIANQLGIAMKDVLPVLVESFKVLFGKEPRGGALGAQATRSAEGFLASRDAQTALKLLSKEGADAASAFRAFAETRGGTGEFTTRLFEAAQTTAFTTGNFTALNQITKELTEKFGDVATGLKAFGAPSGAQGNQAVSVAAKAAQEAAKASGVSLREQKGFLARLEKLSEKGDVSEISKAIERVFEKSVAEAGGGATKLSKSEQFQVETLSKLRDALTGGAPEATQKIDVLRKIEEPVAITPKDKEGLKAILADASVEGITAPIVNELLKIAEIEQTGFANLDATLRNATNVLAQNIESGSRAIVDTLFAIFSGSTPGGPQFKANTAGSFGSFPRLQSGGVTKKDTPATIHKGEVIAPLSGFYREMNRAIVLAFRSQQNQSLSRAGLSVRPTGLGFSSSRGGAGSGSEARLSSLANAGRGFEASVGGFANRLEAYAAATERSIVAARSSIDSVGAALDDRTRNLERVTAEERSKHRRLRRTFPPVTRSFTSAP